MSSDSSFPSDSAFERDDAFLPDSAFPPKASTATEQVEDPVRRWYAQSDEEFLKHVDRRNQSYRVGWPRLPPLPVSNDLKSMVTLMGESEEYDFWRGWVELQSMTYRFRGSTHQPFFAYRRPVNPDPSETYLSLVLIVERPDKVQDDHILRLWRPLQRMDLRVKVSIEFIIEGVLDGFYLFPISPNEPFLMNNYDRVYNKVLAEIQKQREDWTTVEIAHFGVCESVNKCPPTILITTPTAAKDVWYDTIIPNLRRSLWGLPKKLRIEVLCGASLFIEPDFDRHTMEIEDLTDDVTIGASISEAGANKGSATVGGMIKLENGMTYALSNDHVFSLGGLGKGITPVSISLLHTNKPGAERDNLTSDSALSPEFLKPMSLAVNCPSDIDKTAFERSIEDGLEYTHDDTPIGVQSREISRRELQQAKDFNPLLGHLYAASGHRTVEYDTTPRDPATSENEAPIAKSGKSRHNYIVDWSLIEISTTRVMTNTVPSPTTMWGFVHERTRWPWTWDFNCNRWTTLGSPIAEISKKPVGVIKLGRIAGSFEGHINPVPVIINPKIGKGGFEDLEIGDEGRLITEDDCGHALAVYGDQQDDSVARIKPRSCGSLALRADTGEWLGLFFGRTSLGSALMTPIEAVIRDIEKVTGQRVVEPFFAAGH